VKQVKPGAPQVLSLGATFGMSMRMGLPYTSRSTVIEFEQDRRIAWKVGFAKFADAFVGGRIFRYELEPIEGGTLVRESWDISQEVLKILVKPARGKARAESLRQLREGKLEIICAVDVFNEGVDVPDINTVLMLRPTESPVVFLQQLGRVPVADRTKRSHRTAALWMVRVRSGGDTSGRRANLGVDDDVLAIDQPGGHQWV